MKLRRIEVMTTLVLLLAGSERGAGASSGPELGSLGEFVGARVEQVMEEWRVPGGIVLIISGGEVLFSSAYGVSDLETGVPIDFERTRFRLASISKPVTASAAMRLHQQGRLDLESDVHRYLGDLRFEGPGTLTTAHLLTHTGGFEDRFLTRMSRRAEGAQDLEAFLADQMPDRVYGAGLVSLYSNHGMALAGLVVERIVERPFPAAARELVFEPLGMGDSSFELQPGAPLARGHRYGRPVSPVWIKTVPASMLVSTGPDMARFMKALLRPEGEDFLDRDTVDLMLTRHFEHHPTFTGRAYGFSEDSSLPRRLFHSGSLDGFSAGIVLVPEAAGGMLVAFNGNAYVWDLINQTLEALFPRQPMPASEMALWDGSSQGAVAAPGTYVPAELPRGSFDKARALFEQIEVGSAANGALLHRGRRYEPRSDGTFADETGQIVVPRASDDGQRLLLEEGAVWRRIPWHAKWQLHLVALGLLLLALVLQVAGRPLLLEQYQLAADLAGQCFRFAAALLLVFVLGTGTVIAITMSQGGGVLRFEIPWYLELLLWLPPLSVAVTALAVLFEILRSRGSEQGKVAFAPLAISSLTVLAAAAFCAYWRMFGFHF